MMVDLDNMYLDVGGTEKSSIYMCICVQIGMIWQGL